MAKNGEAYIDDATAIAAWWDMTPPRRYAKWIKATGIGKSRCERLKREHGLGETIHATAPPADAPPVMEVFGDDACTTSTGTINTLDQLADACGVDRAVWRADKLVTNRYGEQWQIKAWWRRIVPQQAADMVAWYREQVESIAADAGRFKGMAKVRPKGEHMLEISVFDLHLGKHAWREETGYGDYDLQIAQSLLHDAINYLYDVAPTGQIGRVLLPIGNDLYHIDTIENTTTAGTRQDVDGRWQKIFRAGFRTYAAAIERIATACEVHVVIVPGNHDFMSCFYLGETLAAHFRDHPNVTIDNRANPVKYHRYGTTLLGFAHGKGKGWKDPRDMGMRMANDRPDDFAAVRFKDWHLGHLHHYSEKEAYGVRCRILPSLTPPDAWHASEGYVGNRRAAVAFLYDKQHGPVAEYTYHA